jgi:hypothetical protein
MAVPGVGHSASRQQGFHHIQISPLRSNVQRRVASFAAHIHVKVTHAEHGE